MDSPAICSVLRHPLSKGWGVFCDFFPYLPGVPAMYGILRHPSAKGWGIFRAFYPYLLEASPVYNVLRYPSAKGWGIYGNFLPYLPEALPLYGPLRHPTSKGWGVFRDFYPYLRRTPTTCAALSACKSSPSDHQTGLAYTTVPFSVRNSLASASRTERCRFSVPDMPESGSRTGEDSFLYRTENRPEVIEF